jgi:hypothetical protein
MASLIVVIIGGAALWMAGRAADIGAGLSLQVGSWPTLTGD